MAIVGKPNVGKSSLLNKLAGQQRVVVDDVAGTTVDPVDELVEVDGEIYRFIDTAGIRRRVKEASGHEYYASLRTHGAIERAEVCVVVVDASEPVTEQDLRIFTAVEEAGRALVIAFNKWDLTDEERRRYLRAGDRARPGAVRVGGQGQHLGHHRAARGPARAGAAGGAGRLGDPHLDRAAERLPRPGRRRPSAPGAGRQAAADPVRHPGAGRAADLRALHLGQHRARATCGSSSAGCGRSSASSAPRCTSRSGPGRSARTASRCSRSYASASQLRTWSSTSSGLVSLIEWKCRSGAAGTLASPADPRGPWAGRRAAAPSGPAAGTRPACGRS